MLTPSMPELLLLAIIALIVLGPKRLPEAARSLGKGMREMRDSFQGLGDDDDPDSDHDRHPDLEPDPESGVEDLPELPEDLLSPEEKGEPTATPARAPADVQGAAAAPPTGAAKND